MMTKRRRLSGKPSVKTVKIPKQERLIQERLKEDRLMEERMRQVLLLLERLTQREEVTVKLILDCLYDVGSVNLINQKVPIRPLNKTMKLIATLSKPVFVVFGWYWFKKNCPQLITNWLQSKVFFLE
jgi:hypothetical protein